MPRCMPPVASTVLPPLGDPLSPLGKSKWWEEAKVWAGTHPRASSVYKYSEEQLRELRMLILEKRRLRKDFLAPHSSLKEFEAGCESVSSSKEQAIGLDETASSVIRGDLVWT